VTTAPAMERRRSDPPCSTPLPRSAAMGAIFEAFLAGEIDETTTTWTRGHSGERSQSVSVRQMPVMPASVLRTLPFGTAVLLLRHTLFDAAYGKPFDPDDLLDAVRPLVERGRA